MQQKFFVSLLLVVCYAFASAQVPETITGHVVSRKSSEALSAVTVSVKGTRLHTLTDSAGDYAIRVPEKGRVVLEFTYVGYTTREVEAAGRRVVNVELEPGNTALDDIVVVGYQTMQRRDVTGAVSSVNAKQLKDFPLSSAAQALEGRLAGVNVSTAEGAPGADVVITVRGGGSITQDNSPIYIVDGIQVENALSVISPQDIASVDVLKDAASTAIYGARGANGVVIITTKSGTPGRTRVSYNASFGYSELLKKMPVLSPYDFVMWQYERYKLIKLTDSSFFHEYGSTWDTLSVYKHATPLDWQGQVFGRHAGFQNHNIVVNGGNQNTTYNLSLTDNIEDGLMINSGLDRKLVNFKLDHKASDKFRMGLTVRYMDQVVTGAGTSSVPGSSNGLRNSIQYRPLAVPTEPDPNSFDPSYYAAANQITSPVLSAQAEYRQKPTSDINLSGYFSYRLLKNLTFRSTFGFDNTNIVQNQFHGTVTYTAHNYGSFPVASIGYQKNTTINNSNTLEYSLRGKDGLNNLHVLLGEEIYQINANSTYMETRYFPANISPDQALANMGLGSPPSGSQEPNPSSSVNAPNRTLSFFGRVNYEYNQEFLASVGLRSDRSSKFSSDNGLMLFPSASFGWRFSHEKFMEKLSFINDAKLRIGYGIAGNNRIGDLLYEQLYGVTGQYAINRTVLPGFAPSALANPGLKWERTASRNVGLDLSMLNNRVQFTVDAYYNTSDDLLLQVAIPPTTGYTSQVENVGGTSNRGLEFQVSSTLIQKKNFSWSSNFNISFNRNRVESLGALRQQTRSSGYQGADGADDFLVRVGSPVGLMYGLVTDGFYKVSDFDYNASNGTYTLKKGVTDDSQIYGTAQPGQIKLRDINGDGIITLDSDRTVIGNANPTFFGGWNNQFTYKNFDFSIFVNFVYGNKIDNANKTQWTDGSWQDVNMLAIMKNRFTNIDNQGNLVTDPGELTTLNKNARIWSPVRNQRYYLTSWAVEDGSFLRLSNLTLGYSLPRTLLSKAFIAGLRIYATVNNLATITHYSGYDPEVSTRRSDPLTPGVDLAGYPRGRTWLIGANINF
ncbi:MAG TPA: TonB-dependent receptor [Puia sp.]|nr:TonB-dependent receptor [Puia sp.]